MLNLRLYVSDRSDAMERAIAGLRETLDRQCKEPFDFEVLDIFKHLDEAHEDNVLVTPTLIKREHRSSKRVVGDLSDGRRVLNGLEMCTESV